MSLVLLFMLLVSFQRFRSFLLFLGRLYGLVDLVVKASALRAEDQGFESRLRRDFSGSSHTSNLRIGTPTC